MSGYELIGSKGSGSAIVEMAFAPSGVPVQVTEIPYLRPGPERDRLLSFDPLGQVPTLLCPNGEVMTESAAMVLHLDDQAQVTRLLPPPGDTRRARALDLLILFVAAIYPTVTFSDPPEDWTLPGPPAERLGERLGQRKQALWSRMEAAARPAPFLFGERPGAPDLYVAAMTHWRPGPAWFARNTPRLAGVGRLVAAHPATAAIMAHHFSATVASGNSTRVSTS